jgi:pimeloyl-ACP methyl ester carboxylesterase
MTRKTERIATLLAVMTLTGCGFSNPASVAPTPGYLDAQIDLGGRSAHIWCYGQGSRTVIYEPWLGALGESALPLIIRIGDLGRVCVYDRANVPGGKSDPAPAPRSSQAIVDDLHALLTRAGIAPPYVLVGDSFGAMNAVLFAARYPGEVAALALIEPLAPDALLEMLTAIPGPQADETPGLAQTRRRLNGLWSNNSEGIDMPASAAEVLEVASLDRLPMLIVQADAPLIDWLPCDGAAHIALERAWRREQAFYQRLSARTTVVTVSGGHDLLGDDPDGVAAAILGLVRGSGQVAR